MRHLLSALILCAGLSLPAIAVAQEEGIAKQEQAQSSEKSEPPKQEETDIKQTQPDDDSSATDEEFDVDSYFKRGEDNIYKGSNCAPPPDLTT